MPKETIKYSNDDITVVWKPKACIHSAKCFTGLPTVFNPRERPWIKMEGDSTQAIIDQVNKCPSGALSYFMNDLSSPAAESQPTANSSAPEPVMLKVEVAANGPYIVHTACKIIHSDGREEMKEGKFALCRCGHSANKPYCDRTHLKVGFKD